MSPNNANEYFEFLAELGITKHGGEIQATRELIKLCHIESGNYILDVGCGVGATPAYLAKEIGCRVMGVDLLEKMVEQARQRAKSEGIQDLTEFRVADARELPFEDNLFDAVISESVNIFLDDKSKAMSEYVRVTKPGGYVGFIESSWLKTPPPDMEEMLKDLVYGSTLNVQGWKDLMLEAGLVDVVGRAHQVNISSEGKGRIERYGWWRYLKVIPKTLWMTLFDRKARGFMKGGVSVLSNDMLDFIGNGVYAGRKE